MEEKRTLTEILATLDTNQLRFVAVRPWCNSDREAARVLGVSESLVYSWTNKADVREAVDLMAQDGVTLSQSLFSRNLPRAAMEFVDELDHRSVQIRHKAAKEILDRGGVPSKQRVQHSGPNDEPLMIVFRMRDADEDR